jgi:hypothetical protein
MMSISARRASSLRHATAMIIAAAIAAGTASPCWAATSPPANATETGWQNELVNRPGCWTEGGYDTRYSCDIAGRR